MLRKSIIVSKSISKTTIISQSLRGLNFWNKSSNSSKRVPKANKKLSLAYYCFDPSYLSQTKSNPIIVYHGLFTSKDIWQMIVKPLSQQTGRAVYLLDMRNHGESPHTKSDDSDLKSIANDVNDFMDEFKINKAILIGHGIGSRAMLQTAISFGEKVEKVVAIDISPVNLPIIGQKATDEMLFTVAALPTNIGLSQAKILVKSRLNRYFGDKILLQYILMNLKTDENGFVKWRFNLPVIIEIIRKGIVGKMSFDNKYLGDVLVVCGKYGLVTAQDFDQLKNVFPNAKFNFAQCFRHFILTAQPKKLIKLLVDFVGEKQ